MKRVSPWRTGFVAIVNVALAVFQAWQGSYIGTMLFTPIALYFGWRSVRDWRLERAAKS